MKRRRIARLLAAYGASPNRWPAGERLELEPLAPDDPALVEARRLDSMLDAFAVEAAGADLPQQITARAARLPQQARSHGWSALRVPFRPTWPQVAWLTASVACGVLVGSLEISAPTTVDVALDVAELASGDALVEEGW